jgi:hypothetical protein
MRIVATVIIGLVCTAFFVILGLQIVSNAYDLLTRRQLDLYGEDDEEEPAHLSWPADWVKIAKHLLGQIAVAVALIVVIIHSTF